MREERRRIKTTTRTQAKAILSFLEMANERRRQRGAGRLGKLDSVTVRELLDFARSAFENATYVHNQMAEHFKRELETIDEEWFKSE